MKHLIKHYENCDKPWIKQKSLVLISFKSHLKCRNLHPVTFKFFVCASYFASRINLIKISSSETWNDYFKSSKNVSSNQLRRVFMYEHVRHSLQGLRSEFILEFIFMTIFFWRCTMFAKLNNHFKEQILEFWISNIFEFGIPTLYLGKSCNFWVYKPKH